ncbi:hypothetical protein EG328_004479 [Venturia inaequalis]|uniref:Uncharacterized protein n=1 Tax=Venturia inaequalis TaxID=5025 RepID=A0A8H3YTL9_VENIN|nr:hypothetical protein EG328_004479 [Venturia inaequalis]KAE9992018.1 hypothetical protein EG327_010409 [Venturia inaequalis]RDI81323.1 hypothetical protein Vi05172_g8697 [Venturia inaequalis]
MVALSMIIKAVGFLNLAGLTIAGVVPKSELVARSCSPEPPRVAPASNEFPKEQLVNNATSLFAWQFTTITMSVGSRSDANSLGSVVNDANGHMPALVDRVNAVGMNGEIISRLLPYRNGCSMTVQDFSHMSMYARLVFQTELMIFPQLKDAFSVLCDNWDLGRLQTVYKTQEEAEALYDHVCTHSVTGKPTKSITATLVPDADMDDLVSSMSSIFTWKLLGALMNSTQVETACTRDWDSFSAQIKKAGLKPSVVQSQLCTADNQKSLPNSIVNVDSIKDQIKLMGTHLLVTQLLTLSGERNYLDFVCNMGSYKLENVLILGLDDHAFSSGITDRCARMGH